MAGMYAFTRGEGVEEVVVGICFMLLGNPVYTGADRRRGRVRGMGRACSTSAPSV
jgi:hypothetical protein